MKLRNFCTAEETINQVRESPQNGKQSFLAIHVIDDQYSEYTNNSKSRESKTKQNK